MKILHTKIFISVRKIILVINLKDICTHQQRKNSVHIRLTNSEIIQYANFSLEKIHCYLKKHEIGCCPKLFIFYLMKIIFPAVSCELIIKRKQYL